MSIGRNIPEHDMLFPCIGVRGRLAPAVLAIAAAVVMPAGAQTVSPPVAEYVTAGRGTFDLSNKTLFPLRVVLEPRGFTVTERGAVQELPLDTAVVRVRLSASSVRIPPRGRVTIAYEATAAAYPAWFVIVSTLVGARTSNGLAVRVELPHVVYLQQPSPLREADVAVVGVEVDAGAGRARVHLRNASPRLGRVRTLELSNGDLTEAAGSFPLLPGMYRMVELPWRGASPPAMVALRLGDRVLRAAAVPLKPPAIVTSASSAPSP
ncbi:MAG TPA: hypothetical protein VFY16_06160 [Gemmatimonadaceae bacterium]|nr:hypothetical protein [Gemmatimonadaceae bacterium]